MTSMIGGTDTNFSAIADIHYYLTLNGTDTLEKQFSSGSDGKPMITWKQWMDYILLDKTPIRATDTEKIMAKALSEQKIRKDDLEHATLPFTVYDALKMYPNLSKFKNFVDYVGYGKLKDTMHEKITLFAPVNEKFDQYFWYLFNISWNKLSAVDALRYHILPYYLLPWQMEDRKLRLRTDLEHRQLDTDCTNGRKQLLNPLTYTKTPQDWFPNKDWEVNILGIAYCDNGIIYIIDRPLVYPEGVTGTN